MNLVLRPYMRKFVVVFLNDIRAFGSYSHCSEDPPRPPTNLQNVERCVSSYRNSLPRSYTDGDIHLAQSK